MSIPIANALIAYKNLLDNDIVSQEFFEQKKEEALCILSTAITGRNSRNNVANNGSGNSSITNSSSSNNIINVSNGTNTNSSEVNNLYTGGLTTTTTTTPASGNNVGNSGISNSSTTINSSGSNDNTVHINTNANNSSVNNTITGETTTTTSTMMTTTPSASPKRKKTKWLEKEDKFVMYHKQGGKSINNIISILPECGVNHNRSSNATSQRWYNVLKAESHKNVTKFFKACETGKKKVIKQVIDERLVNLEVADPINKRTGLHTAVYKNKLNVVKMLVDGGANINTSDARGETTLHTAAYRAGFELFKYLVEKGGIIDKSCSRGMNILHYAVKQEEVMKYVLPIIKHKNVAINKKDKNGLTPLFHAVGALAYPGGSNLKVIKMLVEAGAKILNANNLMLEATRTAAGLETKRYLFQFLKEDDSTYKTIKNLVQLYPNNSNNGSSHKRKKSISEAESNCSESSRKRKKGITESVMLVMSYDTFYDIDEICEKLQDEDFTKTQIYNGVQGLLRRSLIKSQYMTDARRKYVRKYMKLRILNF